MTAKRMQFDGKQYNGFDHEVADCEFVAIVAVDGSYVVYGLDKRDTTGLERYLDDVFGGSVVVVGVYTWAVAWERCVCR